MTLYPKHGIQLCLEDRDHRKNCLPSIRKKNGSMVTDCSWTSETSGSCWNKFHNYFLPQFLFNKKFSLASAEKVEFAIYVYISPLYQKKYAALGIEVTLKKGKNSGVGRIHEKLHSSNDSKDRKNEDKQIRELTYLQQDSNEDDQLM